MNCHNDAFCVMAVLDSGGSTLDGLYMLFEARGPFGSFSVMIDTLKGVF